MATSVPLVRFLRLAEPQVAHYIPRQHILLLIGALERFLVRSNTSRTTAGTSKPVLKYTSPSSSIWAIVLSTVLKGRLLIFHISSLLTKFYFDISTSPKWKRHFCLHHFGLDLIFLHTKLWPTLPLDPLQFAFEVQTTWDFTLSSKTSTPQGRAHGSCL